MPYLYPSTTEQERLLAIMYDNPDVMREPKKKVLERAEAGRMLAALGDPRTEVMTLEGMHFCHIPAGSFQLGSHEKKFAYKYDHPAVLYEIPYDYWLGRYPVTQAQFQAFVEDNGYRDERWWSAAQAVGCWSAAGYQSVGSEWKPFDDPEPRVAPMVYTDPYMLPNHPVVGVSWHESLAFTEWLTARWRMQGFLTAAQQVVLPNEPEWEKAARGGTLVPDAPVILPAHSGFTASTPTLIENPLFVDYYGYPHYPYGNAAIPFKSNYDKSKINTTNAVGIFHAGRSAYGCEELCGGAWEWTRSGGSLPGGAVEPYPYDPACESLTTPYLNRILRGGAYHSERLTARCGRRAGCQPIVRAAGIGLRVAVK